MAGETRGAGRQRELWGNQVEYLLSCLGYAVGLGNIWRFPYLCYRNGGGAFLIPYLLTLVLCGIPLVYLETSLGQFASAGCVSVFNITPLFKGAGYAIIVLNLIATTYFSVLMSYPLLYMYHSFSSPLPWESCDNPWNTENCTVITGNKTAIVSNGSMVTPEDEFFHIRLLRMSSGLDHIGGIVWPVFFCNLACWLLVYCCICNGVKSVGKIVYFTVLFPYLVLAILFVRGVTLPGALEGIKFYILPEWSQLKNPKVWADAATQLFFSLGPGWGGLVGMASFNSFHYDNLPSSVIIPLVNSGTSIFAGFVVFSVLGFAATRAGVAVAKVASAGPGLAFVTYPAAVTMMPGANFWAFAFFVMLFFLGIDTMFVTVEAIIEGVLGEWPRLRRRKRLITLATCCLLFCFTVVCTTEASIMPFPKALFKEGGMHVINLLDSHVAGACVPLVCALEILCALYVYGERRLARDLRLMTGRRLRRAWLLVWKYVDPALLLAIMAYTASSGAGGWAGWAVAMSSVACVPAYAVWRLCRAEGTFNEIRPRN